ncbi:YafY family transcriptional regulator [Paenibacillus sp. CC-CFT747]|nr:YafY family transcriptional regulator [Paenibacillus sp. CC-CFT747]
MNKAQRLIQLMMRVNARKSFTVGELADEFHVSTRTITRDLEELSGLGVPLYSVQGRGGGYKLLKERLLPPISFSEGEAVAMYYACQALEHYGSQPFGDGAHTALAKFYHYLPGDVKEGVDRLRHKVSIWSPYRPMAREVLETLLQAVMRRRAAVIRYNSASGESERTIQPIGLYASSGYWYCPAYCHTRGDVRQFRADRIISAALTEDAPWREDVDRLTLLDKPVKDHLEQVILKLELTPKGVWWLLSDNRFGPSISRKEDGSGEVSVSVAVADLEFYIDKIWQLGPEARILAPAEAVLSLKRRLDALRERY